MEREKNGDFVGNCELSMGNVYFILGIVSNMDQVVCFFRSRASNKNLPMGFFAFSSLSMLEVYITSLCKFPMINHIRCTRYFKSRDMINTYYVDSSD